MQIIAVDDEKLALEALEVAIKKADPEASVECFRKPSEAISYVSSNMVDVAFLDIEMRQMSGIELAKYIKVANPKVNIVFSTGYAEYRGDAFDMHASGYITKPITVDKVATELANLRYPISEQAPEAAPGKNRIFCQTFGNFAVYADGKPLDFKYEKTRELLAYLVDRSALCTSGEIMAALWEDERHESYLRNLKKDLIERLDSVGCKDIIENQWGKLGIIPDKIDCDFYDWKKGIPAALNSYRGEYMAQYSWGEFTMGTFKNYKAD